MNYDSLPVHRIVFADPQTQPRRTVESLLEAPDYPNTVPPLAANAHHRRLGPDIGGGNGVFQRACTGKYLSTNSISLRDEFPPSQNAANPMCNHSPSSFFIQTYMDHPGRSLKSTLGVPSCTNSVAPSAANICFSRPGPEIRCVLRVSQPAPPSKYKRDCVHSLPDIGPHFRTTSTPLVSANPRSGAASKFAHHISLLSECNTEGCVEEVSIAHPVSGSESEGGLVFPASGDGLTSSSSRIYSNSPGRIIAASTEEAPMPPSTVEPLPPATCSRPGPVLGIGNGVFRTLQSGKYDQSLASSLPDGCPTSSATVPERRNTNMSIYYQNVGGMNGMIDDYRLAVSDQCYDVIVLTETWLGPQTISSYVFGEGYEVFRCDRNSSNSRKTTGGGVLVAVNARLKPKEITDASWICVEQVWVSIQLEDRQLLLCAVYFPPDRTRDSDYIESHCRSVFIAAENTTPSDEIIIVGDFNLAHVAWIPTHSGFFCPDHQHSSFHPGAVKLLDNYSTALLSQINDVMNENGRTLDLCFVSGRDTAPSISLAPAPLVKNVPHHPPLMIAIEESTTHTFDRFPSAVSYDFKRADQHSIGELLSALDWDRILHPSDVNIAAQTFSHVLAYVIDRHVPKKRIAADSRMPWMTRDLRALKTNKKAAFRRFSKFRTLLLKSHYVRLNSEYKRLSRLSFQRYQKRVQRQFISHPKSFWSYVNQQRKEVGLPSSMTFNGETASNQQQICNFFSSKFASVFEDEQLSANFISSAVRNVPTSIHALNLIDVNHRMILNAATQLKKSFKPGPDGVPSAFLKEHIECLLYPLHRLFILSLSSGIFPSCWKEADMFPVHKKGNKHEVDNYRGITSLSAVPKLFELVVMDPLSAHCKPCLSVDQHGFTAGRSTTTNLLCLTSYITDNMNARLQTDVVYTDLSAAFDKLNHAIAIAKLARLGIGGSLLEWFRSYLTDRQLVVALGDCRSTSFSAPSGIPQGSHLGPLIFLLYFNDVHQVINVPRLSFADDLKIFLRIRSIDDCHALQGQIDSFADWCALNRLVVNPAKCSVITFSRKSQPFIFSYRLLDTTIDRVDCVKDLGVLLDSKLTYTNQISYVVDKASKTLGLIFRIAKPFTDVYCLKSLYCSLVRSTLEYCSAVWCPSYNNGSERIESVQRRFLRFALRRLPWRDRFRLPSYESRCQLIDLEPLRIRRNICKALTVADVLKGKIDCSTILQQIRFNVQPRPLRNSVFLRLPFRRSNYALRSAIHGLQLVFNRVASVFDFHLTRNVLRSRFLSVFRSLDVNV